MVHYARVYRAAAQSDEELQTLVHQVHARKTRHYVQCVNRGAVQLRPGVARLIAQAREQGLQLAIATTTTRENVTALLRVALGGDAMDWFSAVGTAQEVAAKKPDPAVYLWVLDRLKIRPSDALAIEDSGNGLLAARRAGLSCIVTPTSYSADDDFTEAAAELSDLDHHPERLGEPVTLDDLRFWHLRAGRNLSGLSVRYPELWICATRCWELAECAHPRRRLRTIFYLGTRTPWLLLKSQAPSASSGCR